ncbi:MAG: cytochrome b [Gammaproteobacteria bacterium]|nr:cytochrome b [Gammaproteobacteria bacterium]
MLKNTEERYGLLPKLLHWFIAVLIIGLIWLGWYMVDLTYYDRWYNDSLTAHKALGLLVLALALVKIVWTLVNRPPPLVATLRTFERVAAHAAHGLLYLAMLLIPVTGYLISTSAGAAVSIFNWFDVPALVVLDDASRDVAIEVHYYASYAVAVLVVIHALAALKHQFIDKDGTLRRMLW